MEQQLILFEEDPIEELRNEVKLLKKEVGNVRRGLFAKNAALSKQNMEISYEFQVLKSQICRYEEKYGSCEKRAYQENSGKKVVEFNFG